MPARKRHVEAVIDDGDLTSRDNDANLLDRLRNMWQFANLCQWIYIFGKAAKIDESIDVEDIETECLKPDSRLLADLGLALLKLVSSHRGLTHDIFDDQLRKQYATRAHDRSPFVVGDGSYKFADLDLFAKIKVLQQLTQWTMVYPERLRDKMEEQKDSEQTSWRIEPYGWDREDRTYYVLDDNRVYRATEPALPVIQPKLKKKAVRSARRASKRQRTLSQADGLETDAYSMDNGQQLELDDSGPGSWECVAVTLQQVRELLASFGKTKDENEKILRRQLETHLIPILEKQEESQRRKQVQRERELLNLAKMANAKRSSRIAGKVEKQREEDRAREEEEQRRAAQDLKRHEEEERLRTERERDFRMHSRQRRLQGREARRLQHQEELAQLSEDNKTSSSAGRISERRLQVEIERNRQALRDLEDEEEEWTFDCICGLYGQVDDGTHSVACETCNVWQHSKCLNISERDADSPDFHFVCNPCKQRNEVANSALKGPIKLKIHPTNESSLRSEIVRNLEKAQSMKPPSGAEDESKETSEKFDNEITVALSPNDVQQSTSLQEQKATTGAVTPSNSTPNRSDDRPASESSSRKQHIDAQVDTRSETIENQPALEVVIAHGEANGNTESAGEGL